MGEKWLFSATSPGFGYGYESVRIRVNLILTAWENKKKPFCKNENKLWMAYK
jgi:hypothetical protein